MCSSDLFSVALGDGEDSAKSSDVLPADSLSTIGPADLTFRADKVLVPTIPH